MTPAHKAELEQVARELRHKLTQQDTDWECCLSNEQASVKIIVKDIASQQAKVLEAAANKVESFAGSLTSEQCDGCGNYDDVAEGSRNDAYRYAATQLRQLAKDRRP